MTIAAGVMPGMRLAAAICNGASNGHGGLVSHFPSTLHSTIKKNYFYIYFKKMIYLFFNKEEKKNKKK